MKRVSIRRVSNGVTLTYSRSTVRRGYGFFEGSQQLTYEPEAPVVLFPSEYEAGTVASMWPEEAPAASEVESISGEISDSGAYLVAEFRAPGRFSGVVVIVPEASIRLLALHLANTPLGADVETDA